MVTGVVFVDNEQLEDFTFYLKALSEFLQEKQSAYLDEMANCLWDEFEIIVDKSTVCRALKRAKISKKPVLFIILYISLFNCIIITITASKTSTRALPRAEK